MAINNNSKASIIMAHKQQEEVDRFIYPGGIITVLGGNRGRCQSARMGKARTALSLLNNIWKNKGKSLSLKEAICKIR